MGKLMHEDADFYIHVDKKTDITPFFSLVDKGNVFFIQNRVKVSWGSYSIVQATINGFEEILAPGVTYGHINLLSGQDYPIKPTSSIHSFLDAHPQKTFMHFLNVETEWQEAIPRIRRYYLTNYDLPFGSYKAEQALNAVMPSRKLPDGIVAMGRSQWFTITPECAAYIVKYIKEQPWVSKFFKLSWAPDELIFQTILYNSPLRETMVNDNLLYVDWSKGTASPKVLTMEDAGALKASDKLFARKFNTSTDSNILDYLDKMTS